MLENIQNQSPASKPIDEEAYTLQIRELKESLKQQLTKITQLEGELKSNSQMRQHS